MKKALSCIGKGGLFIGATRRLREELLSRLGVGHADGGHGALLGGLEDDLLGIAINVCGDRLTVVIEREGLGGDGDAHLVANAQVVVDRYA